MTGQLSECTTSNGTCDVVHWTVGHLLYLLFIYTIKNVFRTRKKQHMRALGIKGKLYF